MQIVDTINTRLNNPLRWAAEGINQPWQVKFRRRSQQYTTCWDELPSCFQ
jgi:DNA polymerase V